MQFYEKKWLLVDKIDDKEVFIKLPVLIGNIHRAKGQHQESLEYNLKVLALKVAVGNKPELIIKLMIGYIARLL